jgi:molecular chaperone Hsp33
MVRALALDGQVRLTAIRTTDLVSEARQTHDLSPLSTVALGRFMTGLELMAMDLKNETDEITGIIKCEGELGGMTVVVKQNGDVKGFVQNSKVPSYFKEDDAHKFDVHRAVQNGVLTIIKSQAGANPYSGSVHLVSGEIAEDLTYYMASSEQIPTILGLGVLLDSNGVKHSGGYLVQPMPGASEEVLTYLEQRISAFPDVSYLMEEGFNPAQILDLFIGDPEIDYLEVKPVRYQCDCNKDRISRALATLSKNDLDELAEEGKDVEVHCEFCNTDYVFSVDEIRSLIAQK